MHDKGCIFTVHGLTSAPIQQRLLQKDNLDLGTTVKKMEMLELTKEKSDTYNTIHKCSFPASILAIANNKNPSLSSEKRSDNFKKCFSCGRKLHTVGRSNCPTKN